jgi:hypothetical protein
VALFFYKTKETILPQVFLFYSNGLAAAFVCDISQLCMSADFGSFNASPRTERAQ